MNRTLGYRLRKYRTARKANSFFYFLSHNFLFKHFFYPDLVAEYEAKSGLELTFTILDWLMALFRKVIYFLILVSPFEFDLHGSFFGYFILITVIGGLLKAIIGFNEDDYYAVMLFKAQPQAYARYLIRHYLYHEGPLIALGMLVVWKSLEVSYWTCLFYTLVYLAIHLTGEAIHIILIDLNHYRKTTRAWIYLLPSLVIIIVTIALGVLDSLNMFYLPQTIADIAGSALILTGVLSFLYLYHYSHYNLLFNMNLTVEEIHKVNSLVHARGIDVSVFTSSIDQKKNARGTGFEYLYSLFLARYHKVINRNVILQCVMVVIISGILIAIPLILNANGINFALLAYELDLTDTFGSYADVIFRVINLTFMLSYVICSNIGKKLIQLCFFQLDRYLISYSFYRTSDAILANMKLRIRSVLIRNLIPSLILAGTLTAIQLFFGDGISWSRTIISLILPLVLAVFFSIYTIATYYLLQPYSFEGTIVNKLYRFVDTIVYLAVYLLYYTGVRLNVLVTGIIIAALALISLVLYILVNKKAPKSFRVR